MTKAASTGSGTEVRRILIQSLGLDLAPDELGDDTRLLDGGLGLDSLAGLRIILAIEQHFGFAFDVSDLSRESLESVEAWSPWSIPDSDPEAAEAPHERAGEVPRLGPRRDTLVRHPGRRGYRDVETRR